MSTTGPSKLPVYTVEDYRQTPDDGPRYQLVEGSLLMEPGPSRYHQDISRNLEFELMLYLREHPIGVLYDAPFDVYLDDINVFQPDIAVILNESRHILTDAGAEGAPDLVIEILSPTTRRLDVEPKKRVYARSGVKEMWIIDPEPQRVDVFELAQSADRPAKVWGVDATFVTPLLPGLAIPAATVFAR